MFNRVLLLACLLLAVLCVTGRADERLGAFVVVDGVDDAILMDGEIGLSTPLDFRRALDLRPKTLIVVLASPGGLVTSALILADDIHKLGLGTFIPEGLGCYSACAFVFFAGSSRIAAGELGVHQMASDVPDPTGVQYSTADILDVLEDFDVPTGVLTKMFRTPSESMYVFTPAEVEGMGINRLASSTRPPDDLAKVRPSTPEQVPSSPPDATGSLKLALYRGLDFYGGDLQNSRTPDVVQCATACLENRSCVAFTYNANPSLKKGPNCFLKDSTLRPEAYSDAISGIFVTTGLAPVFEIGAIDPTVDVQKGTDFPGGDLSPHPIADADSQLECRQACISDSRCEGFSYASSLKQCWLKSDLGLPEARKNVASGIKRHLRFEAADVIDLK